MRVSVILAAACAVLSACADKPPLHAENGQQLAVTVDTELPPPAATDMVRINEPYLISPLDKITVSVFGASDLGGELVVDANGQFSMPLVGIVDAAGKTPGELTQVISDRLARYIREPQVAVNVREAIGSTFTVDGQVAKPGVYAASGNMSLIRAIATAQGTTESAQTRYVVIFRTVNGRSMAALYDLSAIRHGLYADPKVYSNDVIVVDDSKSSRLFKQILQLSPAIVTPLVLLLQ